MDKKTWETKIPFQKNSFNIYLNELNEQKEIVPYLNIFGKQHFEQSGVIGDYLQS